MIFIPAPLFSTLPPRSFAQKAAEKKTYALDKRSFVCYINCTNTDSTDAGYTANLTGR